MTEPGDVPLDSGVAPGGVVGGHGENEPATTGCGCRSSWTSAGLGPVAGDATAVPAPQCVRGDKPPLSAGAGECGGDGTEQAAVVIIESGAVGLAVQHRELVAQHDDLQVLGTTRADSQPCQRHKKPVENEIHPPRMQGFGPGQSLDRISGTNTIVATRSIVETDRPNTRRRGYRRSSGTTAPMGMEAPTAHPRRGPIE